jgi:diadenosine tetraphosphatase ApaH/serine/threonine PP2A family protein phosphatase
MVVLILSDIHANLEALEACLAAAPAHDVVWNLGDVVGYGASPNEVIARTQPLGDFYIRGNHDRACSGMLDISGFNPQAAGAVKWTQRELTPEHLKWLRQLPQGPLSPQGGISCVHGSPHDEDEYVIHPGQALEALAHATASITFFGHTHMQGGFSLSDSDFSSLLPDYETTSELERIEIDLDEDGLYLVNPGSVGQPRDGDWRAAFATFDTSGRRVSYYRVPYDLETAQSKIRDAGLPDRLASRLAHGR